MRRELEATLQIDYFKCENESGERGGGGKNLEELNRVEKGTIKISPEADRYISTTSRCCESLLRILFPKSNLIDKLSAKISWHSDNKILIPDNFVTDLFQRK